MSNKLSISRRNFLRQAAWATCAAPLVLNAKARGANDKIVMGCIGMGGQGTGDMRGFLGFDEVQVVAVCDVDTHKRDNAKGIVDQKYGKEACAAYSDFREVLRRPDIDAVLIATPDHWHAIIAVEALKHGKDVYCEKPECLTIREGRIMVETTRRYGRVFSGGSQRVWEDYNWFHRMVRGGAIGQVQEAWVNLGGTSHECHLPAQPVPPNLDWDMWLGPAPWAPYNVGRLNFRPWRDYSGGTMTDWGAHGFGGLMFACELHRTGPVHVIPASGPDHPNLTFYFANGIRLHYGGGWSFLSFRGTNGELPERKPDAPEKPLPNIQIPNYKGRGGIFGDFLHCVHTRELPFRDIEVAHRTVTVCHLGNIATWLNRPLKWDPAREEILGDPEASRWLDRPKREPWILA